MKKFLLLCSAAACSFSATYKLADIPTSQAFYMNLSIHKCDDACQYSLLYDGAYLSFLARFNSDDEKLHNYYSRLLEGLDYLQLNKRQNVRSARVAVVLPEEVLRSYTSNIAAPAMAYLLADKSDVKLKIYYTGQESANAQLLSELATFDLLITGFRGPALLQLASALNMPIFAPLESADNFPDAPQNLYFGAINYNDQVAALMSIAGPKIGIFRDNSTLSRQISAAVEQHSNPIFSATIEHKNYNIKNALAKAERLQDASVFFNVALVKSTLLATELHALEIEARNYLSTQINYHPMFLNLAQDYEKDRFYFASAIEKTPVRLEYINDMLGQKLAYNWIAYATSSGLDALYQTRFGQGIRQFSENFEGSGLRYSTRILSAAKSKFSQIKR